MYTSTTYEVSGQGTTQSETLMKLSVIVNETERTNERRTDLFIFSVLIINGCLLLYAMLNFNNIFFVEYIDVTVAQEPPLKPKRNTIVNM